MSRRTLSSEDTPKNGGSKARGQGPGAHRSAHKTVRERIHAWIARNVVGTDPHPEPSRLDCMDGLDARKPPPTR